MTALLDAYDAQLRGAAEVRGAQRSERFGPLWLGVFAGGFGFITYEDLSHLDGAERRAMIDRALARLREDPAIGLIEWKTRGHDHLPGLHEALTDAGFVPGEPESIMLGEAALLAQDLPLPEGVTLRPVTDPADVRAASAMADGVFGDPVSPERADDLLRRIAAGGEVWVAEEAGRVVSSGRLEPVPGTAFAGLWGGATLETHRHRGIYRALTAARAASALGRGFRHLHSDSTEHSRPILERSGFVKASTTTPWEWRR